MKKMFRKAFSMLVAVAMIAALMPAAFAFASAEEGKLYPDAVYTGTVAKEVDASGKWMYRELVPDTSCEDEGSFTTKGAPTTGSTTQTGTSVINTDKHTGEGALYRMTRASAGIGFNVPTLVSDAEYIISAWMRSDMEAKDETDPPKIIYIAPLMNYHVNTPNASGTTNFEKYMPAGTGETSGNWNITKKDWAYYTKRVIAFGDLNSAKPVSISMALNMQPSNKGFIDNVGNCVNSLYVDDWSMRLAVPADFPASYVKAIAPSQSSPLAKNGDAVKFTYSLDIDPRTVRKENITVNGEANSEYISSVEVTTDEATRETVLSITMANMAEGAKYEIALPEIKDAWGREVIGANNATVYAAEVEEGQYTIFGDLDDSGFWKYRELIPDVGCETIDGFWTKGNVVAPQTSAALSTVAYNGNYSVSRTMQGYAGLGAKIPNIDLYTTENPAEYILTLYARADLAEGLTSINMVPCYYLNADGAHKELAFSYPNANMNIPITEEWKYYSKKLRITGYSSIDKEKDIYAYFYANARDASNNAIPNTIYLDEWSLRRMLPNDFPNTKFISASGSKDEAVFKFNLDIDPRTVRKNMVAVNGEAESSYVKDVKVTTNEITRETTVTVSLQNLPEKAIHTITLPEIKDAWGRTVNGNIVSTFGVGSEDGYTIYDDLDASGKWAYRNIVPDPECEDVSVFYDGNISLNPESIITKVETASDAHSGSYSIARTLKIWGKIGFAVKNYDTEATYYTSLWMKSDNEDAGVSVSFANNLGIGDDGKRAEQSYATSFSTNATNVTSDWKYYSSTLKLSNKPLSNPADGYMWIMNNEKANGVSETVGASTYVVNRIYADDWNLRKIPEWRVNAQGVEVEDNTAVFKFDKDIDPWTVTADKILVNGEAGSSLISSVDVVTDEITRETTLTVTMNETIDDECVIALPKTARDAWGREIINLQSTGFVLGKAHIIDANGEIVSAEDMTAGVRSYKVTGIQNNSANPVSVASVIALYDANGVCVDVNSDSQTFAKGTIDGELCSSITIPEDAEGMSIKTFIWNMNTLYPYNKPLKVLVIGNSYTYHNPNLSYGWIGDWGMAASAPEKDYVHILQNAIKDVNSGVQMKWFNISNLEKYYLTKDVDKNAPRYYQEAIDFDADVIIATFGANIGDGTWEGDSEYENVSEPFTKNHYKYIIDKFNPGNDAVVIAGNTMSEGTALNISKKTAIYDAAQENGYIFVDVADIILGYPAKAEFEAEGGAEKYKNALDPSVTETGVIYGAVLTHPGDEGMKLIAERLFDEGIIPAFNAIGMN